MWFLNLSFLNPALANRSLSSQACSSCLLSRAVPLVKSSLAEILWQVVKSPITANDEPLTLFKPRLNHRPTLRSRTFRPEIPSNVIIAFDSSPASQCHRREPSRLRVIASSSAFLEDISSIRSLTASPSLPIELGGCLWHRLRFNPAFLSIYCNIYGLTISD